MRKPPVVLAAQSVLTETAATLAGAVSYQTERLSRHLWCRAGALLAEQGEQPYLEPPRFGHGDQHDVEASVESVERVLAVVRDDVATVTHLPRPRDARGEHPAGRRGNPGEGPA